MDYTNQLTVDATQIEPAVDAVTVTIERPAEFEVFKQVSPYQEGDDGDGVPTFGNLASIVVNRRTDPQNPSPDVSVWYRVFVQNVGVKTATNVSITDTRNGSNVPLPFGQSTATAECDPEPTTMTPGQSFVCRYQAIYSVTIDQVNVVGATSPNVNPDANDQDQVTVDIVDCNAGNRRVVPNLVGLTKAQAVAAWAAGGFQPSRLNAGTFPDTATIVTQNAQAYRCENPNNFNMTITNVPTP
jgi:hypothetical protein